MIVGKLKDISTYKGISKNLDTAIQSIINQDYLKGSVGKNSVDGDSVFYLIAELETKDLDDCRFETHNKYIDIQIVIEGNEKFGFCLDTSNLKVTEEYDSTKDCSFFDGKAENLLAQTTGDYIMFFAKEPHMPCVKDGNNSHVKKAIYKVAI